METATTWGVRLEELRAGLRLTYAVLGDRTAPEQERTRAAAVFAELWPRYCAHVRAMPDGGSVTLHG